MHSRAWMTSRTVIYGAMVPIRTGKQGKSGKWESIFQSGKVMELYQTGGVCPKRYQRIRNNRKFWYWKLKYWKSQGNSSRVGTMGRITERLRMRTGNLLCRMWVVPQKVINAFACAIGKLCRKNSTTLRKLIGLKHDVCRIDLTKPNSQWAICITSYLFHCNTVTSWPVINPRSQLTN